jgi:hypothetical protein
MIFLPDKTYLMTRNDFLKKTIRASLFLLLALLVFALGKKVVAGKDCSGCPGNEVCNGKTDCSKY